MRIKKYIQKLPVVLCIILCLVMSGRCFGQAVPDTTMNHLVFDTTDRAKLSVTDTSQLPPASTAGTMTPVDTTGLLEKKKGPFQPNPKKAGLFSAIVPGLGQLYDRQYWKVPVIYVGIGVAAYFISTNLKNYQTYRKSYVGYGTDLNDPNFKLYTQDQLKQLQDDYEKYLDLTVLFTGLGFAAQIVDAVVYAHLHNFDISQDISMKIHPVIYPQGAGLGFSFNFK